MPADPKASISTSWPYSAEKSPPQCFNRAASGQPQFAHSHPCVPLLPIIQSCFADPQLPTHLQPFGPAFNLLQRLIILSSLCLFRGIFSPSASYHQKTKIPTVQFRDTRSINSTLLSAATARSSGRTSARCDWSLLFSKGGRGSLHSVTFQFPVLLFDKRLSSTPSSSTAEDEQPRATPTDSGSFFGFIE